MLAHTCDGNGACLANDLADGTTCVECRLCLDEPGLRARGLGIGFRAHGSKAGTIRRRLTVIAA